MPECDLVQEDVGTIAYVVRESEEAVVDLISNMDTRVWHCIHHERVICLFFIPSY